MNLAQLPKIPNEEDIDRQMLKLRLESSLWEFCLWVFREIYRKEFVENWHLIVLCRIMEEVYEGKHKRLVINLPPRYTKTEIVIILFKAWSFAKNQQCNFLHVSYSDALALRNSSSVLRIILSREFQSLWPCQMDKAEHGKKAWKIAGAGGMNAAAAGGAVTGFGAGIVGDSEKFGGLLSIDDPQKANTERFENSLGAIKSNYDNVLSSRINSKNTPIVLIMQRLHEDDLSGHLLSGNSPSGEFEHVCIEALKEEESRGITIPEDKRKPGEALWPFRHTSQDLERMRKGNPVLFAGQYAQRPSPAEGNMVKRDDLKFYTSLPQGIKQKIISCDLNFKQDGSSNAALSCYGIKKPYVYLLGQKVGKWNFTDAVKHLKRFIKEMNGYSILLIEEAANGHAMIATLRHEGFHNVRAIKVDKSKTFRMSEVLLNYSGHSVYYPDPKIAPWILEHIDEILTFPNAANDDRVDAETMLLKFFQDKMRQLTFQRADR